MDRSKSLENYTKLNNSFEKKMTFHLGAEAGFFSEFNNMVLAILYCLQNEIKFTLYSKKANFALEKGWRDFFTPFCEESTSFLHSRYNRRGYQVRNQRPFPPKALKFLSGDDFLTQDIWDSFRNENFSKAKFTFPTLELNNASLLDATQRIISMIWNYNPLSKKIVDEYKNSIKLPDTYLSMHIRAGDKIIEANTFAATQYMEKVLSLEAYKTIFVMTDDFSLIKDLKNFYSDWEYLTLETSSEKGYDHSKFKKLDKHHKYMQLLKLFASLDICTEAENYIGTYSSNIGMFMGMRIGEEKCIGVDYDSWVLW